MTAQIAAAKHAQDLPPAPAGFSPAECEHWRQVMEQLAHGERDEGSLKVATALVKSTALVAKLDAAKPSHAKRLAQARETALRATQTLGLIPGSRRYRAWINARTLEQKMRAQTAPPGTEHAAVDELDDLALLDLYFESLLAGGPPEPEYTPRLKRLLADWDLHTAAERAAWLDAAAARQGHVNTNYDDLESNRPTARRRGESNPHPGTR